MKRNEIDDKYKWNLTDIYAKPTDIDLESKHFHEQLLEIKNFRGHILDDAGFLLKFIKKTRDIEAILERIEVYTYLLTQVEMDNMEAHKYADLSQNLINEYNQSTAFVIPEILESNMDYINSLLASNEDLKPLSKFFKDIFRGREHSLSEKEEQLLNLTFTVAEHALKSSQFLRDKEIDYGEIVVNGEKIKLLASNIPKYYHDPNRDVRRSVFEQESAALKRHIDSLATNYIGYLKAFEQASKFKKFSSYLEQKFFYNDIDLKVYQVLREGVINNNSAYRKYVQLFKDVLKLDQIECYDMNAPLVQTSDKVYTAVDAQEMILDALAFMGDEYNSILKDAFDGGVIDYFPCENKATGWCAVYSAYTKPRVLANFEGKVLDISSLAHELGHYVNQSMILKTQIPEYVSQSSFCAEVASLTNEIILSLKPRDDKEAASELLFNFIRTFACNFFGAARQALFEEAAHNLANKEEALTSAILNDLWKQKTLEVYGDDVTSYSPYAWACIPHFFLGGGYYVYNYATAIVAATNVYKSLMEDDGFKDKYLEYLALGSSMSPLESLRFLGIDMLDAKTIDNAIVVFNEAIDKLYEILEIEVCGYGK